ncbi:MAG: T9SS type A sorting domain-containing protein [Ignavibacteriales bacterium]|nr:MAG: T9SS type A sorting domain-containing protein [Ignavibacteriales bacterium]
MFKRFLNTVYLFSLIFLQGINLTAQDYQDWKFVHPTPQANNLRAVQMIDADNWVSAGANGTFMRTSDAGNHWYFHHQAGRYSNAALAIGQNYDLWFFNSLNGFVVGDRGYIGKTIDGGATFDSVGLGIIPTTQRCNGIWFANQDTGYIAAGAASGSAGTIARTTDGGITWTSSYTASTSFLAISGTSTSVVYAVGASGTIYKSTDAGQTWNPLPSTVSSFMYAIEFLDDNNGLIAGSAGGIFRTTDAGTTWNPLVSPQVDWAYFQIEIVSATEIYLAGDPTYLYKSTDFGTTWTQVTVTPVSGPAITFVWYSMDKIGNRIVLSGDYGVVAKSDDNGANWSANHFSHTTQLLYDLEKIPGTNTLAAVGRQFSTGTKQLFISNDGGVNWSAHDLGVNFNASSISMVNSQIGYISGTNTTVLKTTDGCVTWNQVTAPTAGTYDLYSMEFVNPDTGWVFVNFSNVTGGNIFKTTDGGMTWNQQTNGLTNSIYFSDMVNENIGFHCINSTNRPIFKTTNGGTTWDPITTPLTGSIRSVKALDENNVYIVANSGTTRMARTTDGGTTWIPITLPITVDITSMDFVDTDTGYVCGNTTTVIGRTTDKGVSWSFENVHLPTLLKVFVLPGDTAFAFGTYGSILKYDPYGILPVELASFTASVADGGVKLNWSISSEVNNSGFVIERKRTDTDNWLNIAFVEGRGTSTEFKVYEFYDQKITSGQYNYRIKQVDYDGSFSYYNLSETVTFGIPEKFELSQNYPNPFNPATTISYSIPVKADVTIKVFDILGNEVHTLVNESKDAGNYSINFNASDLSSGVYFYNIKAGKFNETKKMALIK